MKHTIDFFRNAINEHGKLNEDERTLLFMIPLIQVAWSHGAISAREALIIFEIAREDGIDPTHWFNEKIDSFLVYQPSARFFEDCIELMNATLAQLTVKEREQQISTLLQRCEKVAAAAGDRDPMDVDHRISTEEANVLSELYSTFGRERASGARAY